VSRLGALSDSVKNQRRRATLYSLYEVSLEVIVVETYTHYKKTRSALDAIVGKIAMFVKGDL